MTSIDANLFIYSRFSLKLQSSSCFEKTFCAQRSRECVGGRTNEWLRCHIVRQSHIHQENILFISAVTTPHVAGQPKKHALLRKPKNWCCGSKSDMWVNDFAGICLVPSNFDWHLSGRRKSLITEWWWIDHRNSFSTCWKSKTIWNEKEEKKTKRKAKGPMIMMTPHDSP